MTADRFHHAGKRAAAWAAMLASMWLLACPAPADDVATQGRQVVDKFKDGVIAVRLVAKLTMSMGGAGMQDSEDKTDVTGTVIDAAGLTVVSLSETDPARLYSRFMPDMGEEAKFRAESKLTSIKLRFADGKEVPAKIVLRDEDLDLAFIRPEQKLAAPAAAVDLTMAAVPGLLDQVIVVNRLREVGDWAVMASLSRIGAVLQKPRTMYGLGDSSIDADLGAPVFSLDGRVIGILVMRSRPTASPSGMFMGGMGDLGMMPVIMPAADVLTVAKQAGE